jgi:hypothetical protein
VAAQSAVIGLSVVCTTALECGIEYHGVSNKDFDFPFERCDVVWSK